MLFKKKLKMNFNHIYLNLISVSTISLHIVCNAFILEVHHFYFYLLDQANSLFETEYPEGVNIFIKNTSLEVLINLVLKISPIHHTLNSQDVPFSQVVCTQYFWRYARIIIQNLLCYIYCQEKFANGLYESKTL